MTRLTQYVKDQVLEHLLDRAFGARTKELEKAAGELTDLMYDFLVPPDLQKQMDKLPKGSFPVVGGIYVKVNSDYHTRGFAKPKQNRAVPYHMKGTAQIIPDNSDLAKEHHRLTLLRDALKEEKREAKAAARSALDSVTTVKRLIELWPEVEPFIIKVAGPAPSNQLAVPVDVLNQKLGLGGNPLPAPKPAKGAAARRARKSA